MPSPAVLVHSMESNEGSLHGFELIQFGPRADLYSDESLCAIYLIGPIYFPDSV